MTISNNIGTHIGYSICLGTPHYIFNQDITSIKKQHLRKPLIIFRLYVTGNMLRLKLYLTHESLSLPLNKLQ